MGTIRKASLTNDGELECMFIGSGSAFTKKFYQTNLLVVKGKDHVLIDCGSRGPEALSKLSLTVAEVRNYLITHSHADHIGGLEEIMLINRYVAKRKPSIVITEMYQKELWEMSLRGGAAYNERKDGKYLEFEDFWEVIRPVSESDSWREMCSAHVGGLKLSLFRTMHIPDSAASWADSFTSYGVIIDDSVLFSSDTRFDEAMIRELDAKYRFKAIFHDCQLYRGGVHASLDELSTLPPDIKSRMWLVHYQDTVETAMDKAKEQGFKGFVQQWKQYSF